MEQVADKPPPQPAGEEAAPLLDPSQPASDATSVLAQASGTKGHVHGPLFRLVTWPPFDFFILFVIVCSCVVMATQSPLEKAAIQGTPKGELYDLLEETFTWIFTIEVCLKLLAFGPALYFADGWNSFDFIVVSSAWLQRLPGVGNYTALRAVRVLRALRMVNRVKSLKSIITTLLEALPELRNVAALFAMFIFLFGIIGVNLFEGKMHSRCTLPGESTPIGDYELCVADSGCDAPATCVYYELGPNYGALSFDDVISAFATIFQAVTLEGWVDQMYMLQKTAGGPSAIIFYLLLVIVGAPSPRARRRALHAAIARRRAPSPPPPPRASTRLGAPPARRTALGQAPTSLSTSSSRSSSTPSTTRKRRRRTMRRRGTRRRWSSDPTRAAPRPSAAVPSRASTTWCTC